MTLNVFYKIGGTASNGVDYAALGNHIVIPAGTRTNSIVISPINLGQTNTKTVVLELAPSPMLGPVNYRIGSPDQATVYILPSGVTNIPPIVRITNPQNGAVFHAPMDIPLYAYATDPDDGIASVEFFANGNSLGLANHIPCATPLVYCPSCAVRPCQSALYALLSTNVPMGNFLLTAAATDLRGASTVSDPITISVLPASPPPTNGPIVSVVATDPIAVEGTNCWTWPRPIAATATWSNWPSAITLRTNCGPKNAIFTIRRDGPTNAALTVTYDLGGTASNGVDYVELPGTATIPAGERSTLVPVVPIDDGPPDRTTTVILALRPSPVVPAAYDLGVPRKAAAIILDGLVPRPVSGMLAANYFHVSANGPDGAWFRVEYSTDLLNWSSVCTNQIINGGIDFVDPDASTAQSRLYRTVPESGPPAQ